MNPGRRHRADYRDEQEHAEVARVLAEHPAAHPARVAYSTGAREAADSISLSHLVADRHDMVQALTEANLAAWRRTLARQGGYLDGDTLGVLVSRKQTRLRLTDIDAPERKQAFGTRSRQSLAELCHGKDARDESRSANYLSEGKYREAWGRFAGQTEAI